jgi:hypothetical protein
VKSRRISNQPTYKPRSYWFSNHLYMLHKVRNDSWIHRSSEHKVITNQVQINIAEASSFKTTHTFSSDTVPVGSHLQQKHQMRDMEWPLLLVLVVAHRRIQAVNAIAVVHLTICNNNGNNALSTRRYSARLTRLKPEIIDTKEHARLSLVGLANLVAKSISYYEDTTLSTLHHLYYDLSN